jgi:hypothetical protein
VRHHWISRVFASTFSLWLAVCLAEPVQLHTCAMHGGLAIEQHTPHDAHSLVGRHGAMHSGAGHSHQDQNGDKQSGQCSCLGDCNAGSTSAGLTAAAVLLLEPVQDGGSTADFHYSSPALVAPHFLLPFGNGPPAGSSRA